ncbi:hypothetical protein HDU87_005323 [Geranomyces variabilis]|uniref:SH3 domain-containing protein n=1 Tax=Geranomyces variabilis TaxID=109894 RepID=A0AAD5XR94_9FUNG|nr:hypothetical protein HDU87_005323 [Geranomyces variabilis]
MSRARALYDCQGDSVEELSFRTGDCITDVKPAEDEGWFTGKHNEKEGLFPGNYVQLLKPGEEEKRAVPPPPGHGHAATRTMSASSSTGSLSSLPGGGGGLARYPTAPSTGSGLRRDLSTGSLASDSGSTGFRANLRPTAKPQDFSNTSGGDEGDEVGGDTASTTSDPVAAANRKLNAHATRMAIQEKSNAMVKAGRESIASRKSSFAAAEDSGTSTPPWVKKPAEHGSPGLPRTGMPRSTSGASIASDHSGTVAELRGRFANASVSEEPPVSSNIPVVANRPALLQSNQSITPPQLPSRGNSSPLQLRKAAAAVPPPPPTRPSEPVVRSQSQTSLADPVDSEPRTLKPSELRAGQSPFASIPQQSNKPQALPAGGPPLPSRRPVPNPVPTPSRPGAGAALGIPTAVQVAANAVAPPIPSRPSASTAALGSAPVPARQAAPPPPARRPAPPPPQRASASAMASPISAEAVARYLDLFQQTDTDRDGLCTGEEARNLWLRSGLDNMTLGLIWILADRDEDGCLDSSEFCIGMYLIDERLGGRDVPKALTPALAAWKAAA